MSLALGTALAMVVAVIVLRWLAPLLEARVQTFVLANCPAPGELETRIVFLQRRSAHVVADCGPLVAARGGREGIQTRRAARPGRDLSR